MPYTVEILDSSIQPITSIPAFVPLNDTGDIIEYGSRLSEAGTSRFRVATIDPLFTKFGDILQPWVNHVRIKRSGSVVWQGLIQDTPQRNSRYIEVRAYEYLSELNKNLVHHDPLTPDNQDTRTFSSGTMAGIITTLLTEYKAEAIGRYARGLTIGTIENPNFPTGFTNLNGASIAGQPWTFSSDFQLQFDFKPTLHVIQQFANYSGYDLELTKDLVFNFRSRFGTDRPEMVFEYGQYGMIDDFEAPLDGQHQVNHLIGIAADNDNNILKLDPSDEASKARYGKLDDVAAYADVKNKNALLSRLQEELRLNSTPDTELRVVLNDKAYPVGQYQLGDSCTFRIHYGAISFDGLRRIIGIRTRVHNSGNEHIILETNKPRIA